MAPYFLRNIIPRREKSVESRTLLQGLASLTFTQYLQVFCGWLAWTCDSIDFFSVSLSVTALQDVFHKETSDITTSITLTLLFRPVGAILFGIISDRYGRRWPLVVNLLLCCFLQIGSGFVQTFRQFLAVRSLFGITMGGVWGLAAATALENLPVEVRGFASGIVQQGYAVGYLIAAVINLRLVPAVEVGWRALFWTASGISFFAAIVRVITPESEVFLRVKRLEKEKGATTKHKTRVFFHETKEMLKRHWLLCVYAVLLMTGFNFLSHGSQDLYPTYLEDSKNFSSNQATIATIIGNCGAIAGGAIAGWASQYLGRRLTIVIFVCLICAFIPLWILPSKFSPLAAGAFWIQFGVQGAWGVIPIFLSEISPPAFRGTFPGVAYQLGNMISSASAQIEATGGQNLRTTIVENGVPTDIPDYARVQSILIGVVSAFVVCVTIVGPEHHGARFEHAKTAVEEGGGADEAAVEDGDGAGAGANRPERDSSAHEKGHASAPDSLREEAEKQDV
ncbi:MFS general substrate transporter [Phellopilus nigrolimitatus]|nr:MFS general substrate transporter [Phellopilus nigrolimitatus]